MDGPGDTDLSVTGVCFPDIAKCGLPYVPAVFAFMTFAGALKSRFKDVANVFRHPGSLLIIMLLVHVVIPTASCRQAIFSLEITWS